MIKTHAVGIDLGTTYSCVAYLNERGEPVTIPNQEGELCTPSVVMYEEGEEIVGTEALRNAIVFPKQVVQNAKRFMGDQYTHWVIEGKELSPVDISAAVLRKVLADASKQIGPIDRAVVTVPAQFSDLQRQATVQAGMKAGLKQVDIINEPVAAALCYVLGKEGLWFTELAEQQRILVYDLGGGTFDLSLVKYHKDEVTVIASSGDLHLGGIDWNEALLNAVAEQFVREFKEDPRKEPESLQALTSEVEQCKRSLTTRPRAALICQHSGKRKTYQIEQAQFNQLTAPLVKKSEEITREILEDNNMGWAHVDVVLTTGGSSRMPMIRSMLQKLSGRTLNTSLSPDQAIAHGAAYYAGMLLTNSDFAQSILNAEATARLSKVRQQSVNARGLGILVRDTKTNHRVPHYMIPANTPLPTSITHTFGTVVPNQRRVMLRIVESGATSRTACVEIGDCAIDGLPADLPVDSHIAVTISYDSSAKIHVSAKDVTSGLQATTQIIREENLLEANSGPEDEVTLMPVDETSAEPPAKRVPPPPRPTPRPGPPMANVAETSVKPPPAPPRPNLDKRDVPTSAPAAPVPAAPAKSVFQPAATSAPKPTVKPTPKPVVRPTPSPVSGQLNAASARLEESAVPVLLCNECGEPLSRNGACAACGSVAKPSTKPTARPPASSANKPPANRPPAPSTGAPRKPSAPSAGQGANRSRVTGPDDDEIMELPSGKNPAPKPPARPRPPTPDKKPHVDETDTDFWSLPEK